MQALVVMGREHEAIARIVARLEDVIEAAATSATIDGETLVRLIDFFEREVDGHHQEKEERVLLPRMRLRSSGDDALLVETLLADHGAERVLLGSLRENLEGAAYGEPGSTAAVVSTARAYIEHQRLHSSWENTVVFPLARRCLSPLDDQEILAEFRRLDLERGSSVVLAATALEDWLDRYALTA